MYSYGEDFQNEMDIDRMIREFVSESKKRMGTQPPEGAYRKAEDKKDAFDLFTDSSCTVYRNKNAGELCEEAKFGYLPVDTDSQTDAL